MERMTNHTDFLTDGSLAQGGTLGPKEAWKMGKLFQSVWFVEEDWQELGTKEEIAEPN